MKIQICKWAFFGCLWNRIGHGGWAFCSKAHFQDVLLSLAMLLLLFIEFYRSDYLLQAYNYITYLIIAFADVFWNFVFRFYVYSFHNNSGCLMQWSFVQFSPEYNRNTANSTCRSICETVEYYRPIHASVKRLTLISLVPVVVSFHVPQLFFVRISISLNFFCLLFIALFGSCFFLVNIIMF